VVLCVIYTKIQAARFQFQNPKSERRMVNATAVALLLADCLVVACFVLYHCSLQQRKGEG